MENRFPGPKSAVFKGSLGAHTLINAAVSLLAQSSLAQLYLSRVALLQTPFPVTLILLVHSVPASQKLSTSIYRAWLSNLAQPSLTSLACPTLPRSCGTHSPRSITGTSAAWQLSCPHPTASSMDHRTERNFLFWECSAHSRLEHKCHCESLKTDQWSVKVRGKTQLINEAFPRRWITSTRILPFPSLPISPNPTKVIPPVGLFQATSTLEG